MAHAVGLGEVFKQWLRIGCIGFGGPPAHIALLRKLCVQNKKWMTDEYFEDAIATCNLLPGPASTQLSILCAWTVAGLPGAIVGGLSFILPGLSLIIGLAYFFLASSPPQWLLAAGAGASGALAVVALHSGVSLLPASWKRTTSRPRWVAYVIAGVLAAIVAGTWVVVVLLACGVCEVLLRRGMNSTLMSASPLALMLSRLGTVGMSDSLAGSLVWTAAKVGALSYGGGFVIIPLMFTDAVERYAWMTESQFLDAVVLGQITPGPVVQTVAVVGYAASGVPGALVAAMVAFLPSFVFIGVGARHFDRIRTNVTARSFLDGAGPGAIGAIIGVSVPLLMGLSQNWQFGLTAVSALLVFAFRRPMFHVLLMTAILGIACVQLGLTLPV